MGFLVLLVQMVKECQKASHFGNRGSKSKMASHDFDGAALMTESDDIPVSGACAITPGVAGGQAVLVGTTGECCQNVLIHYGGLESNEICTFLGF